MFGCYCNKICYVLHCFQIGFCSFIVCFNTNVVIGCTDTIFLQIQEFVFEISDDPLEVRLRDNYELLEDEYKESFKRQKMLDVKVA